MTEQKTTKKILISNIIEQELINLIFNNSSYRIGDIVVINPSQNRQFLQLLSRIDKGEPLDYIVGHVELNKLRFYLNRRIFIPRPCTSELIEIIKEDYPSRTSNPSLISSYQNLNLKNHNRSLKLIDICAGSGYIGLSLAKYFNQILLIEKSKIACETIGKTADYNKIKNFEIYNIDAYDFDYSPYKNLIKDCIVVCNPPYVPLTDYNINSSVNYEPKVAIYSGKDGLTFFKKLIKILSNNLPKQIYFELDPRNILTAQLILNNYYKTKIIKDSEGYNRFLIGY